MAELEGKRVRISVLAWGSIVWDRRNLAIIADFEPTLAHRLPQKPLVVDLTNVCRRRRHVADAPKRIAANTA